MRICWCCVIKWIHDRSARLSYQAPTMMLLMGCGARKGSTRVRLSRRHAECVECACVRSHAAGRSLTMKISFTKKPMKPMMANPTTVCKQIFLYSAQRRRVKSVGKLLKNSRARARHGLGLGRCVPSLRPFPRRRGG